MQADLVELLRCPMSGGRLTLEAFESDGPQVEAGFLRGPAVTYPIVAGIPILQGGFADVVESVRRGEGDTAAALAVLRRVPLSRLDALLPVLGELRPGRPLARLLAARRDRRLAATGRRALAASLAASDPDPVLRLTHVDNRRPNLEGYRYFRYRLGLPRHLVALGAVAGSSPGDRPVIEIGCGAGHMTWQIARLVAPRRTVGVEREFDLLWAARRHIAPDADLVCADALALPVADGSCSLGVAVDVLSFVGHKHRAVRELQRVVAPGGGLVLTSLINAGVQQEYAGDPLPSDAWWDLVRDPAAVALSDTTVLDHYLDGRTPPSADDAPDVLEAARTITVLSGPAALDGSGRRFDGWPHARGRLGPHPLLEPTESPHGEVNLRRRMPSPAFARDNPDVDRYLPEHVDLPASLVRAVLDGQRPPQLEPHLRTVSLVGYPDGWPPRLWPDDQPATSVTVGGSSSGRST